MERKLPDFTTRIDLQRKRDFKRFFCAFLKVPSAREPEVLSTMSTTVNKLKGNITDHIPKIFDALFECTLEMINKDFEEFPEHRTNFFLLLQVRRVYYLPIKYSLMLNRRHGKPDKKHDKLEFPKDHYSMISQQI